MRDEFLKALRGEAVAKPAWVADISYWISGERFKGTADPAWDTEDGFINLCRSLHCMGYFWFANFWAAKFEFDETVAITAEKTGNTTICQWSTPIGAIHQESCFLPTSSSEGVLKHAVESEADLDVFLYLLERRIVTPDNIAEYPARLARWAAADMVPCLGLPRAPFSAFLTEWAGIQNGTYLLFDHPEKVERALAIMDEQEQPIIDAVCRLAPPVVHVPDNLTSENYTGFFETYLADNYRRRLEKLHAAGIAAAVHLDGTVRGLIPKLTAAGFDAIEALTPMPVGDVSLEEMRAVAGSERVTLWGGVPGAMFAPPYKWSDMKKHVEKLLKAWAGTPFIVGVADQIPPDGDIQMCKGIWEVIERLEG